MAPDPMSLRRTACQLVTRATQSRAGCRRALATAASSNVPPVAPASSQPSRGEGPSPSGATGEKTTHFGFRDVAVDEKEKLVKGVFDSVASQYDLMNDLMSAGLHRVWKDDFVRLSGISAAVRQQQGGDAAGMKLLDVAGGTGDIAFRLMKSAHAAAASTFGVPLPSITICDINAEMLKYGKKRAPEHFRASPEVVPQLSWVEGNAECLPFPDQSFDLYTIAFGLRNVTNRDKALKEAFRVMKKGGRFMCLEFSHVSLPVVQQIYDVYSFEVIPRVGQAVTGDRAAYQYLVESIRKFPNQEALVKEIEGAGFGSVGYTNYTLGTVAVHSGFRWT